MALSLAAVVLTLPVRGPGPSKPGEPTVPDPADIAVVGGGPAGLHAALKAALLYHTALVFDKGPRHSRIFFAPRIDNIPGFPGGISGAQLLKAQRAHIVEYERDRGRRFVEFVEPAEATSVRRPAPGGPFEITARMVKTGAEVVRRARAVVLATGLVDRQPYLGEPGARDIRPILPYANKGTVNYCLLCDAHTVEGKRVAVVGADAEAFGIAPSLRDHFGAEVKVIACIPCALGEPHDKAATHGALDQASRETGIPLIVQGITAVSGTRGGGIGFTLEDGTVEHFDLAFLSLGWWKMNTELAVQLGAALDPAGYVRTSADCEVLDKDGRAIDGLFAIGDIRSNTWNQIPIGIGDAETAVIHAFAEHL